MKNLAFILVLACVATFFSCKDDDGSNITADLFYDQGENTAPFFDAGVHLAAARFPRSLTSSFDGQNLTKVEFYLVNTPSNCKIRIYDEGTSEQPGTQLYEADVTNTASPNAWNTHDLTETIGISNKDLWIAVEVTHNDSRNTIGCDVGPADPNGDWVLEGSEISWLSYRSFTNDLVNINWNIRGYAE